MNPLYIIAAFYFPFAAIYLLCIRRGAQSGSIWHRTTGRVQSFGVSDGVPTVSYTYEAAGRVLTGCELVPGPIGSWSFRIRLPKSLYLHEDGRLRFEPNSEVAVFFNPKNPHDAVLIPGVQRSLVVVLALFTLVAALVALITSHNGEVSRLLSNRELVRQCGGVFFFFCGMLPFYFGLGYWRRGKILGRFKTTTGRLLSAEVARIQGKRGDGYVPAVTYQYEVDNRLYSSTQWGSIPAWQVLRDKKSVEARMESLKTEQPLVVHYDPERPWDAFLRHESLAGALIGSGLMSVVFWGLGMALFFTGK